MKTKLCWMMVCLLAASFSAKAQVQNNVKTSLNKEESSIQKFLERTTRVQKQTTQSKAAANDLLTGVEVSYLQDGVWITGTKMNMDYEGGKMVSQETEILNESEWILAEVTTKSYQNGLLVSETYQGIDGVDEEMEFIERYSYSYIDGILSEVIYEEWVDDEWILVYQDTYTVENGVITEGMTSYWEDGEWEPTLYFMFEEVNDTLIATTQYTDFAGGWDNFERDIYPNLTIEELYDIELNYLQSVELSILLSYIQYPDYLNQEWDGQEWVNYEQQYTTLYETQDQTLESKYINTISWEDGEWKPFSSWVQYYNGKISPDSTVLSFFAGDDETEEWLVYMKESYTYNASNLYDEVISVLYPFMNSEFEYSNKFKFEWNGVSTSVTDSEQPASFRLNPAYPNPFNPSTNITYSMEQAGAVKINVYDMLGRFVATLVNSVQPAGEHYVQFNAAGLSSGLYFIQMEAHGYLKTQKVTLLK